MSVIFVHVATRGIYWFNDTLRCCSTLVKSANTDQLVLSNYKSYILIIVLYLVMSIYLIISSTHNVTQLRTESFIVVCVNRRPKATNQSYCKSLEFKNQFCSPLALSLHHSCDNEFSCLRLKVLRIYFINYEIFEDVNLLIDFYITYCKAVNNGINYKYICLN